MEWRNVVGYEGMYEVSERGEVRSKEGKVTFVKKYGKLIKRTWKQRVLKQKEDRDGYKRVTLWKDGKKKDFLVHRLVAEAFLLKPAGKNIINHIDCNPGNNNVENLEWCDYRHNLMHAFENGLNNSRHKTTLINKASGEVYEFKSKKHASLYLGRSKGYISNAVKSGRSEVDGYKIVSG